MTQDSIKEILARLGRYTHNSGIQLTAKFANGYEVGELVAEMDKFHANDELDLSAEPVLATDEGRAEFYSALKSSVQKLAFGSPAQIFVASAEVADKISDFEKHKSSKNSGYSYCISSENGSDDFLSTETACEIPFLAKACAHLAALQSEVGSIPTCAGEDSATHTVEL